MGVISTAIIGIILSITGILDSGKVKNTIFLCAIITLGILMIVIGFLIWIPASFGKTSVDNYVKTNKLCITGVYKYVRNLCYSGVMFIFSGILLLFYNLWLLILPPIYWLSLTIMVKLTEEKWLLNLYGEEYANYLKKVNRCIPWFSKK